MWCNSQHITLYTFVQIIFNQMHSMLFISFYLSIIISHTVLHQTQLDLPSFITRNGFLQVWNGAVICCFISKRYSTDLTIHIPIILWLSHKAIYFLSKSEELYHIPAPCSLLQLLLMSPLSLPTLFFKFHFFHLQFDTH